MKKRMKVLIGYDGSPYADAVIHDLREAGLATNVDALVVTVGEAPAIPPLPTHERVEKTFVGERTISIVNHADSHVSEALADATDHANTAARQLETYLPSWRVRAIAVGERPATELIQRARAWGAHLVVVGSQGRSAVGRLIFGSVSLEVAIDSPCSVRIGRRELKEIANDTPRILVGVDGFTRSEQTIKHVLKRAWPEGTELRIIAIGDGPPPPGASARAKPSGMFELAQAQGLKVFAEIRGGDPASTLMTEADDWKAHCIFVGAGGFASANDDSGDSVSTQLGMDANCSVEIVR